MIAHRMLRHQATDHATLRGPSLQNNILTLCRFYLIVRPKKGIHPMNGALLPDNPIALLVSNRTIRFRISTDRHDM